MNRVVHFEIQADDVERAKKFYESALGWHIEHMMKKEDGGMDYWGVTTGDTGPGINGGMYQRPSGEKSYYFDCTIEVPDLAKAMDAVRSSGGVIDGDKMEIPNVGWFARARDTEGNRFGIMQPTGWQPK